MNLSYMKSPKAILITGISLLSLVFATAGQSQVTVNGEVTYISQVTPNRTTQIITINGTEPIRNGAPIDLTLGGTPLTVTSYSTTPIDNNIKSYRIDATLPTSFVPASYLLSLTLGIDHGHGGFIPNYTFNVTIPESAGGADGGVPHGIQEFTTPGENPPFTVPSGVTRLLVEVWGAGGGGGDGLAVYDGGGNLICSKPGGNGAAGAYSRQVLTVTAGDNVTITVGQGGTAQSGSPGNPGTSSSVATPNSMITSGGGGGGSLPTDCFDPNPADNGSPAVPDPNAAIRRASATGASIQPALGSIDILGRAVGGQHGQPPYPWDPPIGGTDGYVFIQW
jgi:hypothetical protein